MRFKLFFVVSKYKKKTRKASNHKLHFVDYNWYFMIFDEVDNEATNLIKIAANFFSILIKNHSNLIL